MEVNYSPETGSGRYFTGGDGTIVDLNKIAAIKDLPDQVGLGQFRGDVALLQQSGGGGKAIPWPGWCVDLHGMAA